MSWTPAPKLSTVKPRSRNKRFAAFVAAQQVLEFYGRAGMQNRPQAPLAPSLPVKPAKKGGKHGRTS